MIPTPDLKGFIFWISPNYFTIIFGTGYGPYGRSIEADLRVRRNGPAVCRIILHTAGKCYTRRNCKKQSFFHNK